MDVKVEKEERMEGLLLQAEVYNREVKEEPNDGGKFDVKLDKQKRKTVSPVRLLELE